MATLALDKVLMVRVVRSDQILDIFLRSGLPGRYKLLSIQHRDLKAMRLGM